MSFEYKTCLHTVEIIRLSFLDTGPPVIGPKPTFPMPPGLESMEASQFIRNFLQSSPSIPAGTFPFHNGFPPPMDRLNLDTFPLTSMQKQLLIEQHQKRFSLEESILSAKAPHGGGFSNKNLSNIGGQQAEVNTNEMVICVKSLLAEHNIAQKVSCFKYRIL